MPPARSSPIPTSLWNRLTQFCVIKMRQPRLCPLRNPGRGLNGLCSVHRNSHPGIAIPGDCVHWGDRAEILLRALKCEHGGAGATCRFEHYEGKRDHAIH